MITLNAFKISFIQVFPQLPLCLPGLEFLRTYHQVNHTGDHWRVRAMKDLWMELQTGANCINRVISRILLFHYRDVIWWPFIYFFFYLWGSTYTQKPRKIKFSTCLVPKPARVIFPSPFISYGSSLDIGYEKKRKYRFFHFILCQLEMERPCGFIRTLTRLHRCLHGR